MPAVLNFPGVDANYIETDDSPPGIEISQFQVIFRMSWTDGIDSPNAEHIFSYGDANPTTGGYRLYHRAGIDGLTWNSSSASNGGTTYGANSPALAVFVTPGQMQDYVFTHDGSTVDDSLALTLDIDGVERWSTSRVNLGEIQYQPGVKFRVGAPYVGAGTAPPDTLYGGVEYLEVRAGITGTGQLLMRFDAQDVPS